MWSAEIIYDQSRARLSAKRGDNSREKTQSDSVWDKRSVCRRNGHMLVIVNTEMHSQKHKPGCICVCVWGGGLDKHMHAHTILHYQRPCANILQLTTEHWGAPLNFNTQLKITGPTKFTSFCLYSYNRCDIPEQLMDGGVYMMLEYAFSRTTFFPTKLKHFIITL